MQSTQMVFRICNLSRFPETMHSVQYMFSYGNLPSHCLAYVIQVFEIKQHCKGILPKISGLLANTLEAFCVIIYEVVHKINHNN